MMSASLSLSPWISIRPKGSSGTGDLSRKKVDLRDTLAAGSIRVVSEVAGPLRNVGLGDEPNPPRDAVEASGVE